MSTEADEVVRRRLGARIRALRIARDLKQHEVGERVGCSQKYISQLERGNGSPSWEILVALAHKAFEIKLASLVFGIDEDFGAELQDLSEVIAGRSLESRRDLLRGIDLVLRAGEDRSSASGERRNRPTQELKTAPGRRRTAK